MTKAEKNFYELYRAINAAKKKIENKPCMKDKLILLDSDKKQATGGILSRCENILNRKNSNNNRPTIRLIHHFACSGGSLLSKIIAAQPNVYLLSELNPLSQDGLNYSKPQFTPRDLISQALYSNIPQSENLIESIFRESVKKVNSHVESFGAKLVIRAHSHSDYCRDTNLPERNTVSRMLQNDFEVVELASYRNPIDSYLSLRENNWVHFAPPSFDEYCRRLLFFLKQFKDSDIFSYDEFVESPEKKLFSLGEILSLEIDQNSLQFFDCIKVSGDSGRMGSEIKMRERREMKDNFKKEVFSSKYYEEFCQKYIK